MTQFIPSPKGNGLSCCDIIKLGEVKDRDIVSMSSYTTQTNTTNSSEYSSSGIYIKMR